MAGYPYAIMPQARDTLIAITVFFLIAIATTGIRFYMRILRRLPVAVDDYLMLAALFWLLCSIIIQYCAVIVGGMGHHVKDIDHDDLVIFLKLFLPFESLYGVTLCFIKCSVVCFYLRIFAARRSFRISAYTIMAVCAAWAISVVVETFLLCRPLAMNWDPTIPGGVCANKNKVYTSAAAINIITDYMVMALPIPYIWALQLPFKEKLGIISIFSLGIFITIISVIRLIFVDNLSFDDVSYTVTMGFFWTTLEPCLCIISGNLPLMRALVSSSSGCKSWRSSWKSWKSSTTSSHRESMPVRDENGRVVLLRTTDVITQMNKTKTMIESNNNRRSDVDREHLCEPYGHIHVDYTVDVESQHGSHYGSHPGSFYDEHA